MAIAVASYGHRSQSTKPSLDWAAASTVAIGCGSMLIRRLACLEFVFGRCRRPRPRCSLPAYAAVRAQHRFFVFSDSGRRRTPRTLSRHHRQRHHRQRSRNYDDCRYLPRILSGRRRASSEILKKSRSHRRTRHATSRGQHAGHRVRDKAAACCMDCNMHACIQHTSQQAQGTRAAYTQHRYAAHTQHTCNVQHACSMARFFW